MPNELILIDNLIGEHEAIHGHMKSVCGLMDNWEEIADPESEAEIDINQMHINIRQTMAYLDEGIKIHHQHEDTIMPALIGTPLFEALVIEHEEILKQLKEINYILVNVDTKGFAANGAYLKLVIDNLCRLVLDHVTREDVILRLLKRRFI